MLNQMNSKMTKWSLVLIFAVLSVVGLQAQRSNGDVGIGAQFGQPTGLSLKVYKPSGVSTDILVAWDLDDFFFVNVHGLVERHIGDSDVVHYFIGPGVFLGVRGENGNIFDSDNNNNEVAAGLSGTLGLNVMIGIVELYGQVTPRLELIDETSGAVGGGVGLRFYF